VLCPDLFYVLSGSWINVRNGSRRVFVVHLICDCCRARVVSCYIITCWRTIKISIPEGDKTLHFDTIWILKGKNAAQLDCFGVRFQCRLRDGPDCVWNNQNRRVLIVMYPAFLKFVKPVCILKYSSWMEKDLNHWNVGVDWFATVWVSTWSVENFIGVGRILPFQFQTLLNCCFQYLKFTLGSCKL